MFSYSLQRFLKITLLNYLSGNFVALHFFGISCWKIIVGRHPDGVCGVVFSMCGLSSVLPATSHHSAVLISLVIWVRRQRSGPLGECSTWLMDPGAHSLCSHFPCERNTSWGDLYWHWAVPLWGRGNADKIKLFLPSLMCLFLEFLLQHCARTSWPGS